MRDGENLTETRQQPQPSALTTAAILIAALLADAADPDVRAEARDWIRRWEDGEVRG